MKWLTKIIKAPLHGKILPSFSEQSRPDWSFTVAGLRVSSHSDGLPIYFPGYITIGNTRGAPVSSVPEVGTAATLAVGLVLVAVVLWRRA